MLSIPSFCRLKGSCFAVVVPTFTLQLTMVLYTGFLCCRRVHRTFNMLGMARSEGTKSMDLWSSTFCFGVLPFVRHYRFISSKTIVLCITVLVRDLLGWVYFSIKSCYFQWFGGFCWNKFAEEQDTYVLVAGFAVSYFCSSFHCYVVANIYHVVKMITASSLSC